MATVTIAPPQSPASMTSRRVPLGALPNAPNTINHISYGSLDALKRPRSFNSGQAPPAKKRIVEAPSNPLLRTPVRQTRAEPAVMPPRRATNRTRPARSPQPQPPTLAGNHQREQHELRTQQQTKQRQEQQLAITQREYYRQQQQQQQQEQREQQQNQTGIHTIRAWQRHYRKVFPTIVFYFDSLPDDAALILQKQVQPLGAVSGLMSSYGRIS